MTAVAHEVGLKQSSLYYWFKSKEQLLDEALVDGFNSCSFKGAIYRAQDVPAEIHSPKWPRHSYPYDTPTRQQSLSAA